MGTPGFETIKAGESKHLSLKTTEKIGKNRFFQYLITQLRTQDIPIDSYSHYFSSYSPYSSTYEIILIDAKADKFLFEPLVFEIFYKNINSPNGVDIFAAKDFFALYMNQKFFGAKCVENAKDEDIRLFVSQSYGREVSNIYYYGEKDFKLLKENYTNESNNKNFFKPLKQSNRYRNFLLFTSFCFILFAALLFTEYKKIDQHSLLPQVQPNSVNYDIKQNKNTLLKTLKVFEHIKNNSLILRSFEQKRDINILTLQHRDKIKLLNFIKNFEHKKTAIDSIDFDAKSLLYTLEIKIEN